MANVAPAPFSQACQDSCPISLNWQFVRVSMLQFKKNFCSILSYSYPPSPHRHPYFISSPPHPPCSVLPSTFPPTLFLVLLVSGELWGMCGCHSPSGIACSLAFVLFSWLSYLHSVFDTKSLHPHSGDLSEILYPFALNQLCQERLT